VASKGEREGPLNLEFDTEDTEFTEFGEKERRDGRRAEVPALGGEERELNAETQSAQRAEGTRMDLGGRAGRGRNMI
jgi:hypothetical protein